MSDNPFSSPTPADPPPENLAPIPVVSEKPVSLMVFGILNLFFGILGACCIGGSGIWFGMLVFYPELAAGNQDPALELIETNYFYSTFIYVSIALGFIFSLALAVAGYGLIRAKQYGRKLSIIYCYYQFATILVGLVVNAILLYPTLIQGMDGPNSMVAIVSLVSNILSVVIGAIYPTVLLYFMYRPNVIQAVGDN